MLGIHDFWLFCVTAFVLIIAPGPDMLFIIGRSIAQGRRAGVMSALGVNAGSLVHTTAAALGLSVLLARSATAFTVVRWAGAAYLVYLGLRMVFSPRRVTSAEAVETPAAKLSTIFRQAMVSNLLNPKVALFFLAMLPQFVRAESPHRTLALLTLGIVFILNDLIWCLGVAWFAAAISRRFRTNQKSSSWLGRANGALFVGLGIRVARS